MCTEGYTRWPTPSIKVAPRLQTWPYRDEETRWDDALREIREQRAHAVKLLRPLRYSFLKKKNATSTTGDVNKRGKTKKDLSRLGPCELMEEFGVVDGFHLPSNLSDMDEKTKARLLAWKEETGLELDEESQLPEPHDLFTCKNGTMVSFSDALLASSFFSFLF